MFKKIIISAATLVALGTVSASAGDFVDYKKLSHQLKDEAKKSGNLASTAEVKAALADSKNWAVVDVRTMDEWQAARIPGSQRIGREAPEKALEGIVLDDNDKFVKRNIVVVCNTASRAAIEAEAFKKMGFDTVKIYGIETWMNECNEVDNWYTNTELNKEKKLKFGKIKAEFCAK